MKVSIFILHPASVYSCYVGESEKISKLKTYLSKLVLFQKKVRDVFKKARNASPSLIFIDEIDTLVGKRNFSNSSLNENVQYKILSTFLNEMDGIVPNSGIMVLVI